MSDSLQPQTVASQAPPSMGFSRQDRPSSSSVQGILQARILERVAIPFSRGSSQPRDRNLVSSLQTDSLLSELQGSPIVGAFHLLWEWMVFCLGNIYSPVLLFANYFLLRCHLPSLSSVGKESACNAGDPSSIPGSGRSPGEGIGYPLQFSWASLVAQLVKNPPAMRETWA